MRILVTNMGEEIFKGAREEADIQRKAKIEFQKNNPIKTKKKALKINSRSQQIIKLDKVNISSLQREKDFNNQKLPTVMEINSNAGSSTPNVTYSKNLQINQKKLFIPKQIMDRYNSNIDEDKKIKESIIDKKEYKGTFGSSYSPDLSLKDSFALKEIFQPNVCEYLKKKVNLKMQVKKKSPSVSENNFRSVYQKDIAEELENNLNREIRSDSVNLIRYLNNRSNLSETTINRLCEYDDDKINRLNKVCQKIFYNDECEVKLKENISNTIKLHKMKEQAEYKNRLSQMGAEVVQIKSILDINRRPFNDKERYLERHKDIQKVWEKNQINRLLVKEKKPGLDTSTHYSRSIVHNPNDLSNMNLLSNISKDEA